MLILLPVIEYLLACCTIDPPRCVKKYVSAVLNAEKMQRMSSNHNLRCDPEFCSKISNYKLVELRIQILSLWHDCVHVQRHVGSPKS